MNLKFGLYLSGCAASVLVFAHVGMAQDNAPQDVDTQDAQPAASAVKASVADIIVTGSRVKRDGYDAPTPLAVVGADQIQKSAPANIADVVNQMPQLSPSSTPRTGNGSTSTGTAGLNLLDLRGLGANRTLVLVDGQRVAPSTQTGAVDVNNIPSALLSRVDVVTGGASAAYGSDAVAGVVNFIIDQKFEGLKANLMGGITDRNDNENWMGSVALGKSFADNRGHILLSYEHQYEKGIDYLDPSKRDWYDFSYLVPNPAYVAGNGQPRQIVANHVYYNNVAQGGVITTTSLAGTQFGQGGQPLPFNYGTIAGNFMIGGNAWNEGNVVALSPRINRNTLWGRVSYDFSDALHASLEASYGKTHTTGSAGYQRYQGNLTMSASNPYLPESVRDAATAAGVTSFRYGYSSFDLGRPINDIKRDNLRIVGTLGGDLGGSWSWSAYYQYGRSNIDVALRNTTNVANFNRAIDAVLDPATGRITCRSTLTDPTNGCQSLNIFGIGVADPAAIAYVKGTATQHTQITQKVAALAINGEPFDLWAGPVSLAAGFEHREDYAKATGDAVSQTNGWYTGNFKTNRGGYKVNEGFAEIVVPLLRDSGVGKSADFNGAVRITDYSTSGRVETWKLGLTYEPIPDIKLRGVLSRDIRAPSISELYLAGATQALDIIDPANGGNTFRIQQVTDGNTSLMPEKADTLSLGAVVRPLFLPGFSASFDYYNIRVKDAITTLALNDIAARCYAGETAMCSFITRDSDGIITTVRRIPINVATLKVRGFDIDASYRLPLDTIFAQASGQISLRFLATRALEYSFTNNGITNESVGENGGPNANPSIPRWRTYTTLGYDDDAASLQLTLRTVSSGVYDRAWVSGVDIDRNYIAGAKYVDLSGSYRLFGSKQRNAEIYFKVDNLFDRDPPVAALNNGSGLQTNPTLYDVLGRAYRLGVRVRY